MPDTAAECLRKVRLGEDSALAFAEVVLAGSRSASDSITPPVVPQDVPKAMVRALADELTRAVPEIARIAGRLETEAARGEMAAFSVGLTEQIDAWRQAGAH